MSIPDSYKLLESSGTQESIFTDHGFTDCALFADEQKALEDLNEMNEKLLQYGRWLWNPKSHLLTWSKGMYSLMEMTYDSKQPTISIDFYENHFPPEDLELVKLAFDQATFKKDATLTYRHRITTSTQRQKLFHTQARILYAAGGEVRCILGLTRDMTENIHVIDSLDEYRLMVVEREDFLGHGSWEWDLRDDKATWWSAGMYRLFGFDSTSNISEARNEMMKHHLTPESLEIVRERSRQGISQYDRNYQITTPSGETRMLESLGKIIRDRSGAAIKVLGTTRDVTQLRKYERDLQQKIHELNRLNKELEDSAYAASHDLQEPLRKIMTLSDRLRDKFNEALPDDARKYIERIQEASKNAKMLIDSLLEFSRITSEEQTFIKTDLNLLLDEITSDLELKIEDTHSVIRYRDLPRLDLSRLQIKQVFSNLILNSVKFKHPERPCLVDISARRLEISELKDFHLDAAVPHFLITLRDNGIGFEEIYSTKIFQMFSRLHGKSEYPGAGIGLALCKKIIANHKGLIFAHGIPGEGAVFSIVLPESQSQ